MELFVQNFSFRLSFSQFLVHLESKRKNIAIKNFSFTRGFKNDDVQFESSISRSRAFQPFSYSKIKFFENTYDNGYARVTHRKRSTMGLSIEFVSWFWNFKINNESTNNIFTSCAVENFETL